MAFFNFKKRQNQKDDASNLVFTSPSLINPLYKPKTLAELKAEMEHTGINPAPVSLRSAISDIEGIDPIDMPSVRVGGDIFENYRATEQLESKIKESLEYYQKSIENESQEHIDESPKE